MAFPSSILSDTFPTKTSNPSADGRFSITDAGFALHSLGLRKVDAPIAQTEFAALLERTVIESVATESITSVVDRAAIRSRMMSLVIRINDMCLKERWAIVSPTTGLASRLTTISIDAEEVFALEAIDTNATSDYTVDIIAMLPFRLIALPRNASPS
ncbi:MAG: hypothetical protein K8U57_35840 [Planctomycetes bacterium]|nr:hypothetical protein [Planctomycetota bacterium]